MKKIFITTAIFVLTALFTIPALAQSPLSGSWELTKMVKDGAEVTLLKGGKGGPTLVFGENNSISGNGSCNGYRGTMTQENGKLTVGPVMSTKMGCLDGFGEQEVKYFDILNKVSIYKSDEGILHLADADSKNILTFTRKGGEVKPVEPETINHLWIVNKEQVDCQGVVPQKCLQVKKTDAAPWENFYGAIAGFKYKPGKYYLIRVTRTKKKNVPADASAYDYKLVKIMSRTKLMPHVD